MSRNFQRFFVKTLQLASLCVLGFLSAPSMAQSFEQVTVGSEHICALDVTGQVECTTTPTAARFLPPDDLPLMSEIHAGQQHTCGITLDGAVECWGVDAFGVLQVPAFDAPVVNLTSGFNHSCAVDVNNQVQCWGLNTNGQLNVPDVAGGFVKVDAARSATCGIDTNGDILCWSTDTFYPTFTPVAGPFIDLDLDRNQACGLTANGDIDCFAEREFPAGLIIDTPANGPYVDLTVTGSAICGLRMDQLLDCSFSPSDFIEPMADQFPLDLGFTSIERSAQAFGAVPICGVQAVDGAISCFGEQIGENSSGSVFVDLPAPPGASATVDAAAITASDINLQLAAQVYSSVQVELFWTRVPTVFPQISVEVFRDDELIATTNNNASFFINENFGVNDEARYQVRTVDEAGNRGEFSNSIVVNRFTGDIDAGSGQLLVNPRIDSQVRVNDVDIVFLGGSSNDFRTIRMSWVVDNPNNVVIAGFEVRVDDEPVDFVDGELFVGSVQVENRCRIYSVAAISEDGVILDFSSRAFNLTPDRQFRCPAAN